MARIYYGTSSWSEKSWKGVFYPKGLPVGEQLRHYASRLPAVEADVTYYRVPDAKLADGWANKLPQGFKMAAKFPRSIVHCGQGPAPDAQKVLLPEHVAQDSQRFLANMARLGDKCGPLVLQFPYFNKKAFAEAAPFLQRLQNFLAGLPKDLRYAVELRNRHWIKPDLLSILQEHRAALVLVDLSYMPHADEMDPELDLCTTDFTYLRLIGDRKAVEEKSKTFDRLVLDQSGRLQRWASYLQKILPRVTQVHAFANNHYAGHGPATIFGLADLLPEQMLATVAESEQAKSDQPKQDELWD